MEKDKLFWQKLCRDLVTIFGNSPEYLYVAGESWIKKMCDGEDIDYNIKLLESIYKRLNTVKPNEWEEANVISTTKEN